MRFYGVLQRIAVCYLVISLYPFFDKRVWTRTLMLVVVLDRLLGAAALCASVPGAAVVPGRDVPLLRSKSGTLLRGPIAN